MWYACNTKSGSAVMQRVAVRLLYNGRIRFVKRIPPTLSIHRRVLHASETLDSPIITAAFSPRARAVLD